MQPILRCQSHRPWACPTQPWIGRQQWNDLLFAHWPVPFDAVRRLVPDRLAVQTFGGKCWVGVVPFWMSDVMLRGIPAVPGLSTFPELNVRVYVECDDRPGVWFLSLDAMSRLAVWGARTFLNLPYVFARMKVCHEAAGRIRYESACPGASARFAATYEPTSDVFHAPPGSFEAFLVERYCLYGTQRSGRLYRMEVHHVPWPLQKAEATIDATELLAAHGLTAAPIAPVLHFAKQIKVLTWAPRLI